MIPLTFNKKTDKKKPVRKDSWRLIPGWFNSTTTLHYILSELPEDGYCYVEVGTYMGRSLSFFTETALMYSMKGKIYGIDTFNGSTEHRDPNNQSYMPELETNPDYMYEQYLKFTRPIKPHIQTIRKGSVEASQQFEDNSIDGLYLDAAHDYDNVRADLEAWYPKMKKEKLLLAGDDWKWPGVRMAVINFAQENGLCILFPQSNNYIITNYGHLENYKI